MGRDVTEDATDIGYWRDHDGIVHVLTAHAHDYTSHDAEGRYIEENFYFWRTPCGEYFDENEVFQPVYVRDAVTCLTCLEHA